MIRQMKDEEELLELGCYATLDGVVTHDGTEIHMKEFGKTVELEIKELGAYKYVDRYGVSYKEEWLK